MIIFLLKKQKLNDEDVDNPSFIGFGTFNFDNSEVIIVTLRIRNRAIWTWQRITRSQINKGEKFFRSISAVGWYINSKSSYENLKKKSSWK